MHPEPGQLGATHDLTITPMTCMQDDVADPTVIVSLDLRKQSIPPDVQVHACHPAHHSHTQVTFTFGYMGVFYVPVIN